MFPPTVSKIRAWHQEADLAPTSAATPGTILQNYPENFVVLGIEVTEFLYNFVGLLRRGALRCCKPGNRLTFGAGSLVDSSPTSPEKWLPRQINRRFPSRFSPDYEIGFLS